MSILLSSDNESSSSSNKRIQLIEYQMHSLKKEIEKLRKKRKAVLIKKKIKPSREPQKTKSNILRLGIKSSAKDNSSSIQWNISLENSKTSHGSIVEPSNKVKKSWNDSNSAKTSSCSWTEVKTKNPLVNQSSSWGKKNHYIMPYAEIGASFQQ